MTAVFIGPKTARHKTLCGDEASQFASGALHVYALLCRSSSSIFQADLQLDDPELWWFGTMMSTDATEDDMDLARTEDSTAVAIVFGLLFLCGGIS